jgi:hypothetical protein
MAVCEPQRTSLAGLENSLARGRSASSVAFGSFPTLKLVMRQWVAMVALIPATVAVSTACATAGGQPDRIHYCDRDYHRSTQLISAAVADQQSTPSAGWTITPFHQVGSTPWGRAFFARPLTEQDRHRFGNPALPCAMGVYLKLATDSYRPYGLEGGP